MAFKKREKTLALIVAALLLVVLGRFFFTAGWGPLKTLGDRRDELRKEVDKKNDRVARSQKAQARLAEWNRRSLPSDPVVARSLYQNWLLGLGKEAGFQGTKVDVTGQGRQRGGVYRALCFTVQARATIEKLTDFLYKFYSADQLHQIRSLSIKPTVGSGDLDLTVVVEALSLPDAKPAPEVTVKITEGDFETVPDYTPQLKAELMYTGTGGKLARKAQFRLTGSRGSSEFTFGEDVPLDAVRDEVNEQTHKTGVVANVSGDRLSLEAEAVESEVPPERLAASALDEYRKAIVERNLFAPYKPPPPPVAEAPPEPEPPKFDPGKHAYLTAIVGVNGRPEVWVVARTTGEKFTLHEGDSFKVGDLQAKVIQINSRNAEIEFDGQRWLVSMGDNLHDAVKLPDG